MQGGWQPPPGGGYGAPGGYGQPPGGAPPGYGQMPPGPGFAPNPYAGPGAGMGMGGGYGNYEFNDTENLVIDKVAGRAKLWGIISTTFGVLQLLGSCGAVANPGLAMYLPIGIVGIVIGVTFIGVGSSLKMVVQTQGNDLMHMMQALEKMGSAFMIQIVCTIIGVVLAAIVFVLAVFVLVAATAANS